MALDSRSLEVGSAISNALTAADVEHSFQQAGNLFSFFFTSQNVSNFDDAKKQDTSAFAVFFHSLLEQGISVPPSAFEAWFVSGALTDDDVDKIAKAASVAAQQVKLRSS